MQSSESLPNSQDNIFYLEYFQETKDKFSLHFSFRNANSAQIFFEKMNEWAMPVDMIENRVILSSDNNSAANVKIMVKETTQYLSINFSQTKHAEDFYHLAAPSINNTNESICIPMMSRKGNDINITSRAYGPDSKNKGYAFVSEVFDSEYSLRKRACFKDQVFHENFYFILTLSKLFNEENFPKELQTMIINLMILQKYPEYPRYFELHKTFSLFSQNIVIPTFKKTDCRVSYASVSEDYSNKHVTILTCLDAENAKILIDNIQLHTNQNAELYNNEVIIREPHRCGWIYEGVRRELYFKTESERDIFLDLVNLNLITIMKNATDGCAIHYNVSDAAKRNISIEPVPNTGYEKERLLADRNRLKEKIPSMTKNIFEDINSIIENVCDGTLKKGVLSFWYSTEDMQERTNEKNTVVQCLNLFKSHITEGLLDKKSLHEIEIEWGNSKYPELTGEMTISEFFHAAKHGAEYMQAVSDLVRKHVNHYGFKRT